MDRETEALPGIHSRLRALEKSHSYANTLIENMRQEMVSLTASSRRIEISFGRYDKYLEDAIAGQIFWHSVRDEVIKGLAKSAVWAVIVGFCIAIGYAMKAYIIELAHAVIK